MTPEKFDQISRELGFKAGPESFFYLGLFDYFDGVSMPIYESEFLFKEYALGVKPIPQEVADDVLRFYSACKTAEVTMMQEVKEKGLTQLTLTTYTFKKDFERLNPEMYAQFHGNATWHKYFLRWMQPKLEGIGCTLMLEWLTFTDESFKAWKEAGKRENAVNPSPLMAANANYKQGPHKSWEEQEAKIKASCDAMWEKYDQKKRYLYRLERLQYLARQDWNGCFDAFDISLGRNCLITQIHQPIVGMLSLSNCTHVSEYKHDE